MCTVRICGDIMLCTHFLTFEVSFIIDLRSRYVKVARLKKGMLALRRRLHNWLISVPSWMHP